MKTYIALTALSSHWGSPKNTLLLTDGCRLFDGGNEWEKYPPPIDFERFHDIETFDNAYVYCDTLTDAFFQILSEKLERYFNLGFTLRFYEKIIYYWLFQFISACYDRYISVNKATSIGNDICFITTKVNKFVWATKDDISRAIEFSKSDIFNLYLYSDIVNYLGIQQKIIPTYKLVSEYPSWNFDHSNRYTKHIIKSTFGISKLYRKSIHLLSEVYGYPGWKAMMAQYRIARLQPFYFNIRLPNVKLDKKFRLQHLPLPSSKNSTFENLLSSFIPKYIPISMCECLPGFVEWAMSQKLPSRMGVIATSTGMCSNPPLMVLAGVKKRPLAIVEHGGNLLLRNHYHVNYQEKIADKYFNIGGKSVLPSPNLAQLAHPQKFAPPLLVCNDSGRYIPRLQPIFCQGSMRPYHERRKSFLRIIPAHIRPDIRLYFLEYGWGVRKGLDEEFPNLVYQNANITPISQAMADTCLLVLDHYSTSFHKSMATNVPSICFSQPDIYTVDGDNILRELKNVGIWHDTPESAGNFYNELIPDRLSSWYDVALHVNEWWSSQSTQVARKKFCDKFAYTSQNWAHEWLVEFDKLSDIVPKA